MKLASTTRSRTGLLLGVALGITLAFVGVQSAVSKPAVAPPTITSAPGQVSKSTSATFTFTGQGGASFQCSLDSATFAACTSPKTYSGLSAGAHAFQVRAVKAGVQSATAEHTWTVSLTPPATPTITSAPGDPSKYSSASFAFSSSESGVSFECSLDDTTAYTPCSSPKSFNGLADGPHTFRVRAVAGTESSAPTGHSWSIDTAAPAAPTLTRKPDNPTSNATNFFAWTGQEQGLSYECSLENGAFQVCSTPKTWVIETGNYGLHQFKLRAVDSAGNRSSITEYAFKYEKKLPTEGIPFDITGSVSGLAIGQWRTIDVSVHNPNSVTLYVSELTVHVSPDSMPSGCSRDQNIDLHQSDVSATKLLAVPAGATVTLASQGFVAPEIQLMNLPTVNQDACKGVSFDLSYTGTGTN